MECDVLINRGSRTAKRQSAETLRALQENGFKVAKTHIINRANPLPVVLKAVLRRRPALLVIGGGDGTVSSVLSRLAESSIDIGIVPLGTTNNFARSLDIPLDIEGAVRMIRDCKARPVDLGTINGENFTNVASLGVSAEIARHVTDAVKRRWGRMAYLIVGVRELIRHRPFMVTIEDVNKNLSVTLETHQVIVANGRFHAGKKIAEDAAIDNGQLLVFALGGGSKISFIKNMIDFYFGKRRRIVHASYMVGRHVRITTDTVRYIEVDGEVKKKTPAIAAVKAGKVRVRC